MGDGSRLKASRRYRAAARARRLRLGLGGLGSRGWLPDAVRRGAGSPGEAECDHVLLVERTLEILAHGCPAHERPPLGLWAVAVARAGEGATIGTDVRVRA